MVGDELFNHAGASTEPSICFDYNLDGLTIAVIAQEEELAAVLEPLLAPHCSKPFVNCDWTVDVRFASVQAIIPPAWGRNLSTVELAPGRKALTTREECRWLLVVPERFAMTFRQSERKIEVRIARGQAHDFSEFGSIWLLHWILKATNRHIVHAAMLGDADSNRSIVIFAPSGTGKTTTALALARNGFQFAGDDALVLGGNPHQRGLWPVPRRIKVSRRTAQLLPWLRPMLVEQWNSDEQSLHPKALASAIDLAAPSRIWTAGLVVVLLPPNNVGHQEIPIAKTEALATICRDNLRTTVSGVDAETASLFAALAALVAMTRVTAVSVGPCPDTLTPNHLGWR